jgi:hypothetical protein
MESTRALPWSVQKEFVFKRMTNNKQELLGKEFINVSSLT